jgi:hypothetical protein
MVVRRIRVNVSRVAVWLMIVSGIPLPAAAQSLLEALPVAEPATVGYRLGPVAVSPGFQAREIGVDTNVFDEPTNPKKDYVLAFTPTMGFYARFGFTQLFGSLATDLTWYKKYSSERGVSRQGRLRLDFGLARLRPSAGIAWVETRERPNPEIDLRARRVVTELQAKAGYDISPLLRVYLGGQAGKTRYQDSEVFADVALDAVLNRDTLAAEGGVVIAATPFTTVTVNAIRSRDTFESSPLRDSESTSGNFTATFGNDAILRGQTRVGFKQLVPVDPTLKTYKGLVSSTTLSTTGFWRGRVDLLVNRDVDYSFEEASAYFVSSLLDLAYNQRIAGAWDFEVRGSRAWLDYSAVDGAERDDTRIIYGGGLGYNLQNQSRIGMTWEYSERQSPERPDRRYTRRRIYGSWTYRR